MAAGDLIGAIVWRWCRNNQCDGQHPIHDSQSRERQCSARSRLGIEALFTARLPPCSAKRGAHPPGRFIGATNYVVIMISCLPSTHNPTRHASTLGISLTSGTLVGWCNENEIALWWHDSSQLCKVENELRDPAYPLRRDRKSTRLNSSHSDRSRMPSSA